MADTPPEGTHLEVIVNLLAPPEWWLQGALARAPVAVRGKPRTLTGARIEDSDSFQLIEINYGERAGG
jgi:hypothetical protein